MEIALENKLSNSNRKVAHPKMMLLYLGIASMIMAFAALTSAYIVKRADVNTWLSFKLPDVFYLSTLVIVLSSVTMTIAKRAFISYNFSRYRLFLGLTFFFGILFVAFQYSGWMWLNDRGVYLATNPSSSFLFVITGFHVVHLVAGIVALLITYVRSLRANYDLPNLMKDESGEMERTVKLRMISTYWHFVDILWIYLFIFFLIIH